MPTSTLLALFSSEDIYLPADENVALSFEGSPFPSVTDISSSGSVQLRKSCEFSHHTHTCIKKAASSLNQLQEKLERWCRNVISDGESRNEIIIRKLSNINPNISHRERKLEAITSGSALEIYGYTVSQKEDVDNQASLDIINFPRSNLQVVSGVANLLQRIELDRVQMAKLLTTECRRSANLREIIDMSSYKRIHDLPRSVQEEHEKCFEDMQELKWHFEYQSHIEGRLEEQKKQAEIINKKLLANMNAMIESEPHIDEKMELERKNMRIISDKQYETDSGLHAALEELNKINLEFEKTKRKSEHEQRLMAQNILSLSSELNVNLDLFLREQNNHEKMVQDMLCFEKRIIEDKEKSISFEKKFERMTEIQNILLEKIEECSSNIMKQCDVYKLLTVENDDVNMERNEAEEKLKEMRKSLEYQLAKKTNELRKLIMINKRTKKEIQNLKKKIESCENNRISNEKAAKRSITELETIQNDLILIKEQAHDMKHLHIMLEIKLDQEKMKAKDCEEKLKEQLNLLQKQNKEEGHARKVLQARIVAESADFSKKKAESELKKETFLRRDNELHKIVSNFSEQVEKLSFKFEERNKANQGLDRLIEQVTQKFSTSNELLCKSLENLESQEIKLKSDISDILSKQEHMDSTSEQLNKKLCDMASSTVMMNKFLLSNEKSIEELEEELTELQVQFYSSNNLDKKLRSSLAEVQDRASSQKEKHTDHVHNRQTTLINMKELLARSLEENNSLAVKYVNLQNKHINVKNEFVTTYERNMIAQESLRDKESLCELHTRLHEALKCYYQLRGIQTKAGLSRFEDMTKKVYGRLRNIQRELEKCVFNITLFLEANNQSFMPPSQNVTFTRQQLLPVYS